MKWMMLHCRSMMLALALLTLAACFQDRALVKDSKETITSEDVSLRAQVNEIYGGTLKRSTDLDQNARALRELKETVIGLAILQEYGVEVTKSELIAEADRIQSSSLLPDKLTEIQSVFGDTDNYLKIFVRPVLVKRWIYEKAYAENASAHPQAESAKYLLKKIIDTKSSLKDIPDKMGAVYEELYLSFSSSEKEERKKAKIQRSGRSLFREPWIKTVLDGNSKLGVLQTVIQTDRGFHIIEVLKVTKGNSEIEFNMLTLKKPPFDVWLQMASEKHKLNEIGLWESLSGS